MCCDTKQIVIFVNFCLHIFVKKLFDTQPKIMKAINCRALEDVFRDSFHQLIIAAAGKVD